MQGDAAVQAGVDSDESAGLTEEAPLKVLIADDHPLVLVGIRRTLESNEDIEIVGEAHSGRELLALVERRCPDIVLTDLRMPGMPGEECIAQIVQRWPHVKVVVLSVSDDPATVQGVLAAGATAFVVKSVKAMDVASVLRQVSSGGAIFRPAPTGPPTGDGHEALVSQRPGLTERETAILEAIARGLTTKAISTELWVSEHTVKFHLTNIYRKLGVNNRSGAVRYAIENGIAA